MANSAVFSMFLTLSGLPKVLSLGRFDIFLVTLFVILSSGKNFDLFRFAFMSLKYKLSGLMLFPGFSISIILGAFAVKLYIFAGTGALETLECLGIVTNFSESNIRFRPLS